jgi:hypothetical protein
MDDNEIFKKFPQGYWETSGKCFINKHDALVYATAQKTKIFFRFFDEVWENFDRTLIG